MRIINKLFIKIGLCENGSSFGATWRQEVQSVLIWKYFIQQHCTAFLKKFLWIKKEKFFHYFKPHWTTKWYFKMWRNVVESVAMWLNKIFPHLGASWRQVAQCGSKLLGHFEPQKMWRQIEPHCAKWRINYKLCCSTVFR